MHRHPASLVLALLLVAGMLLPGPAARAASTPSSLAGINLGDRATHDGRRIRAHKARAIPDAPWIRRLAVKGDKFFSGGYVLVGTCAVPGRVLRIKMRYRDQSMSFFRNVAGDLLQAYGDPTEYKGGFNGRTMGNKWSFTDDQTRPISLILQHTEGEDPEVGNGTSIKLTNWGMLEAERACWEARHGTVKPRPVKASHRDHGFLPR